ncbi:hypothetical protein [Rhizobium oryzicola]|uniref:Uncharacterized protein n=1 Tax=Rhizobium oryzicola TaxID=1232668 RepID=A0ABT8SXB2_9HYPH|nr:hypothetical protein [Rhizobium oryzicola]MDO1582518.1 hypothetical protein [Rhizobium oryzicola]
MIIKLLEILREQDDAGLATGTYADGAFYLTRDGEAKEGKQHCMRESYDRDFRTARRLADSALVFA